MQGNANGTSVFSELHQPTTNANGLASFIIGDGASQTSSFASINWSNGPFFIKVEIDPAGGSSYNITGTSQLLSVPYALYAGSTAFKGNEYLILSGELTNSQAAAKIAAEAGPDTKFVWIQYSKTLTSVTIPGVTNLIELIVQYNKQLSSVSLPDLQTVASKIEYSYNDSLSSTTLPSLTEVTGTFKIQYNNVLIAASFPMLNNIAADLFVYENQKLPVLSLPSLSVISGELTVQNNGSLNSIDISNLTRASDGFQIVTNPQLLNLSMPAFTSTEGDLT